MKTNAELQAELKRIENELKQAQNNITQIWKDKISVPIEKVYVFDNRVIYYANSEVQVKKTLIAFEAIKKVQKVGSKNIVFENLYRIDIKNDYYERILEISFYIENDFKIQIQINFNNISNGFLNRFFKLGKRHLYDTETVYVNIPAHYQKFKNISIPAYYFKDYTGCSDVINWYGGNITLINTELTNNIIDSF